MDDESIHIQTRNGSLVAMLQCEGAVLSYMWGTRHSWWFSWNQGIVWIGIGGALAAAAIIPLLPSPWPHTSIIASTALLATYFLYGFTRLRRARTELVRDLQQRNTSPLLEVLRELISIDSSPPSGPDSPIRDNLIAVLNAHPHIRTVARIPLNAPTPTRDNEANLSTPYLAFSTSEVSLWCDYGRLTVCREKQVIEDVSFDTCFVLSDLDPWFGDRVQICDRQTLAPRSAFYFQSDDERKQHDLLMDIWNAPGPPSPSLSNRIPAPL